jgi:hypothetical protein
VARSICEAIKLPKEMPNPPQADCRFKLKKRLVEHDFIFLISEFPYAKYRSFLLKTERSDTTILVILSVYGGLAHFSDLSGLG